MRTDRIENVPEPSAEILNPRRLVDYASHRERLIAWLKTVGKDPAHQDGLAEGTALPTRTAYCVVNAKRTVT